MIIDDKLISDIYNLKKKVTGKNKTALSKYQDGIPMYDIYSNKVYFIKKYNVHYRLIECHYRFVNDNVIDVFHARLKALNNSINRIKYEPIIKRITDNLEIMKNYDTKILMETSYIIFYKYSIDYGLQMTICRRNSFDPLIKHLKPYYTKLELIKLSLNMKIDIITTNIHELNNDTIYSICKQIYPNDISYKEIANHTNLILNNNIISSITFYSFIGSFLFNNILRF